MKKVKVLLIIILILIVVLIIARAVYVKLYDELEINTISDITSIKQAITYMDSKYITEKKSEDENFSKDIFVKLKYDLYTEETSNEEYFIALSKVVAQANNFNSYRIVDEEKQILISVVCDTKERVISKRYINGDNNYYGTQSSKRTLENYKETKTTNFNIDATQIKELINNNWERGVDLGEKLEKKDNYEIYSKGIAARFIIGKVYNIIFTQDYTYSVVNGIKVNISFEEVIKILGEPTFGTKDDAVIGYKGQDIYVFFSKDEISVYRVEKNYDFTELEKLIEKFNTDSNVKEFVSGITDTWQDYDLYTYDSNYVNLQYSLKGIKIQFNITRDHGVIIYNNYIGTKKENNNVYFRLEENLVYDEEIRREKIIKE